MIVAALFLAAAAPAAAATPHGPPFAFGGIARYGAYTVTIANDGSAHAIGDGGLTRIGHPQLTPNQLASLNREVAEAQFGHLARLTRCAGALANSATWVRVGSTKVTVVGKCSSRYQRVFKAFVAATQFFSSG